MIVKAIASAVKMAALCAALAVYWRPMGVATTVGVPPPTGGFKEVHEHGARLILTVISYSWALSCSSACHYTIMALIFAQTICWASFLAEESIFGESMGGLIDRQTEKEYAQLGAVAAFGLILFIVLFGGRASPMNQYRRRLVAFYSKHNPDKIADIRKILKKYEGNEELLFARLQRKYSVLSHTAVENKVDEVGEDGDDQAEQEFIEEVEFITPLKTGESEEDDTLEIIKPRVKSPGSKPPSHPASPATKPVGTGALRTPSPSRSPSVSKSDTVRSAIEDARRAQAERVEQRVAQLETRGSGRKK